MRSLTQLCTAVSILAAALTLAVPARAQSAADLRVTLNTTLAEHAWLAAATTEAAMGGRAGEFKDAAGALDANSVALSKAIGSVYGADAGSAFLALWRKHIGFFVDYTNGVARKDKSMQDKAVKDLLGYADDFGA
ncbi:MAG: copper amine oxidase, partial [Gemmatimonadales bacterium]